MLYGNTRRMTAKEHGTRVRFDYSLIDDLIPNNKFKRIFPLDPYDRQVAPNGDVLSEIYEKLDKLS